MYCRLKIVFEIDIDPPLSEPISETIISLPSLNLWHVYHAMLELRAFLFQKEISCYSGVTVAHLSRKQAVFCCCCCYSGEEDREEIEGRGRVILCKEIDLQFPCQHCNHGF